MKNAALVVVVTLIALAVGVHVGRTTATSGSGSSDPAGRWIPGADGTYVTEGVDGRGIVLWTIKSGSAVRARSFYTQIGPGPDGADRKTVEEDSFAYYRGN